jgi:hypothetical protein
MNNSTDPTICRLNDPNWKYTAADFTDIRVLFRRLGFTPRTAAPAGVLAKVVPITRRAAP